MTTLEQRIRRAEFASICADGRLADARDRSNMVTPGGLHGDPATLSGIMRRRNGAKDGRRHDAYDAEAAAWSVAEGARRDLAALRFQAEREAVDTAAPCDISALRPGDAVRTRHGWSEVLKVNEESVTVPSMVGGSWSDRVPLDRVLETRQAVAS